jgi:hypothetical protein
LAENLPLAIKPTNYSVKMKSKLKIVEISKDKPIELPDGSIPLRLERVTEHNGIIINPSPSPDKFVLYYLEKQS